jgi:hypothetical protein
LDNGSGGGVFKVEVDLLLLPRIADPETDEDWTSRLHRVRIIVFEIKVDVQCEQ